MVDPRLLHEIPLLGMSTTEMDGIYIETLGNFEF